MLSNTYKRTTNNPKKQLQDQVVEMLNQRGLKEVQKNPITSSTTHLKNRYGLVVKG